MKKVYNSFDKCIFRTPIYNFPKIAQLQGCLSDGFKEALYLASHDLYCEKIKEFKQEASNDRFEQTIYKYFSRACSRCTPFGLFAGCSVASISSNKTNIILDNTCHNRRITRLDMNYICAFVQKIEQQNDIRKQLKYYPNDSLYYLAGTYRYIEYYYKGVKRSHQISSIESNEYIKNIIAFSTNGKYYEDIVNHIVNEDINTEEANGFVDELIDAQLLKSSLELSVTGDDALDVLISKLTGLNGTQIITDHLMNVRNLLDQINTTPVGTTINFYEKISEELQRLDIPFDPRYLFQTDVFKPVLKAEVSEVIVDDVYACLTFLNKISLRSIKTNLTEFINLFKERYEDREVALLEVLDTELGLGYIYTGATDSNELLNDVYFNKGQQNKEQSVGYFTDVMLRKYVDCIKEGARKIILTDNDIKEEPSWVDLPPTISVMCSIIESQNSRNLIYFKNAGGSCAGNLLGRFCHLENEIKNITKAITEIEQQYYKDYIVAEIVHLPESRIGNILFRPNLRDYEIHYLAQSSVEDNFKIPASDLYISIKGGEIILSSKRLNKKIIPRLTTAHNFSYNASPVYQFLCDLQFQGIIGGLTFNWNGLFECLDYKPRVVYGNCILGREQWKITIEDFSKSEQKNFEQFCRKLLEIRIQREIPKYGIIPESDNELLIDFDNDIAIKIFYSYLNKKKTVWIEEFLFNPTYPTVIDKGKEPYCNEFIFLFHKDITV